jgi:hypothetical protein
MRSIKARPVCLDRQFISPVPMLLSNKETIRPSAGGLFVHSGVGPCGSSKDSTGQEGS